MTDYKTSNRYEKVDWLRKLDIELCADLADLLALLTGQLPTDEFTKIYEYICLRWKLPIDQAELDELNNREENNDRYTDEEKLRLRELVRES